MGFLGKMRHLLIGDLNTVRPRRVGVRVVRLNQDVVLTDFVKTVESVNVINEATIDVILEQLSNVQVHQVQFRIDESVTLDILPSGGPVSVLFQQLF